MTTSAIAVTEGAGKNIWTESRIVSAVTREAQVVLIGEPALPTYTVSAVSTSAITTGAHLVQLMAGASLYVRVTKINISQRGATSGVATYQGLSLYRLTTAGSGGTAITPSRFDRGDAVASATAQTLPTAKGDEGDLLWYWNLTCEATRPWVREMWSWEASPRCKAIVIPPGTADGIALKLGTGVATVSYDIVIEFTETAWL